MSKTHKTMMDEIITGMNADIKEAANNGSSTYVYKFYHTDDPKLYEKIDNARNKLQARGFKVSRVKSTPSNIKQVMIVWGKDLPRNDFIFDEETTIYAADMRLITLLAFLRNITLALLGFVVFLYLFSFTKW